MTDRAEIETRLRHFADHIERWRTEAARLTLQVSEARQSKAEVESLVGLEETATAIFADISGFRDAVDEVAKQSPEAAAELAGISDQLHLVLLEITELGIRFYETHSGLPELAPQA